ncbi:MAG: cytochrome c maturation protein CcmE [Ignavibacteriae bacterium]|nr:cytochrome c maturation protein CcmE [Ignavibacteriota bacterium]
MNGKVILAIIVIVAGVVIGVTNFVESNVEYADFATAQLTGKKAQVKGEWVQDQETRFDAENGKFIFHMKDDYGRMCRVILDGAKPNNFEIATSVVAKGKFDGDVFHAEMVLTKCPSKYEGDSEAVKKSL